MNHNDVKRHWEGNAEAWTQLSRAGYDVCRDCFNTPTFLKMLPGVKGLSGLDIGCGEGGNTRSLAARGARMTALDVSEIFIRHAIHPAAPEPPGADYLVASAVEIPFAAATFDFATGFMSFMDIPETGCVLSEAYRVLKPGGFLQFSITHPCFDLKRRRTLRDEKGVPYAVELAGYFEQTDGDMAEWTFSAAPPEAREGLPDFRIPVFPRTISRWMNLLTATGFVLEQMEEPYPDDQTVRKFPALQDARVVAYFLIIRARKLVSSRGNNP
jgi:SAM-dependent methyltransferase